METDRGHRKRAIRLSVLLVMLLTAGMILPVAAATPVASFKASERAGLAPFEVQFTDQSTNGPTTWLWEFGDGATSALQNPSHSYTSVGTYTVNLTAGNAGGTNSSVRNNYITTGGVIPAYTGVSVQVANDEGIRWDYDNTGLYLINTNGGGLNAVHITTDPVNSRYGQVTSTANPSGTFYFTDTGGRGYQDEAVLMLAVNGTIPDDFAVRIRTSGYTWTPYFTANTAPPIGTEVYQDTALDQTFTKSDFVYGPQNWRPQGSNAAYPIYDGEDLGNTAENQYHILFVDTRAGLLGSGTNGGVSRDITTLIDRGAVRVDYTFTNLTNKAAFNLYAWNSLTSQGRGMGWTNALSSGSGSSGYTVVPPPTVPVADFTASTTTGVVPLFVRFTDTSTNSPTSWAWDFGDGTANSTEQNPSHTYTSVGTYTVTLTATNSKGSDTETKTDYLTIVNVIALPGQVNAPTDPDGDGKFEDMSGNGAAGFADVVLFFKHIEWFAANEPIVAFDFSGNGAIGFQDIVLLFKELP